MSIAMQKRHTPLPSGTRNRRPRWLVPVLWAAGIAVVVLVPYLGGDDGAQLQRQAILTGLMVLLVSGMNLTFGWAGELNMGIPAMYAAGAFVSGWVSIHVVNDVVVGVVVGALAALIVGVVTGVPGLRLGGWVLAIVSFFVVILIPSMLQVIPPEVIGGSVGLIGIPTPMLFGTELTPGMYYTVVVVIVGLWFAVYRNIVRSRVGDALVSMQQGAALAPSLGISRYRLKMTAYALGAIPAGVAGSLYASLDRFIGPETFTIDLAVLVLAASIISGRRSVYAMLIGAAFVQFIQVRSSDFAQYGELVFGALLILGGVAFGGGIAVLVSRLWAKLRAARGWSVASVVPEEALSQRAMMEFAKRDGKALDIQGVHKSFGGSVALDGVSFTAKPGQITALIGPNGSGKTTMLNIVNGFYRVDSGTVKLGDATISSLSAAGVARQGISRTFQTPFIPVGLRAVEVVASANIARRPVSLIATILRLPVYRKVRERELTDAYALLAQLGLEGVADQPAESLALGTRRMIELARALAGKPWVVLLDEVASGLDTHELMELARVLRLVSHSGTTVLLVEHNFALVRSLADEIVVLADGRILTIGTPAEVEVHPDVLKRFLGEMSSLSGTSIMDAERA